MSIQFQPQDIWIGVYWKWTPRRTIRFYVCIVPMLPIVFEIPSRSA